MKKFTFVFIAFVVSIDLYAQKNQPIPENFLNRMISDGKPWKAQSFNQVQVSGQTNTRPSELLIVKKKELIYTYPDKTRKRVPFTLEEGTVDPLLKTESGDVYEVRFFNKNKGEVMRLRKILAPDMSTPYEGTSYMH